MCQRWAQPIGRKYGPRINPLANQSFNGLNKIPVGQRHAFDLQFFRQETTPDGTASQIHAFNIPADIRNYRKPDLPGFNPTNFQDSRNSNLAGLYSSFGETLLIRIEFEKFIREYCL